MFDILFNRKPKAQASVPEGKRIYAVGDIHGRLDLYEAALRAIEADLPADCHIEPEIILLGDLIDRGPDSAQVVRKAMNPPLWAKLNALKGNHEAAMIAALEGDKATLAMWLRVGGLPALKSWGVPENILNNGTSQDVIDAANAVVSSDERKWIDGMLPSLRVGDYFFAHAGVRPGVALEEQALEDLLWIREEFLDSKKDHGAVVVHGHSIREDVEFRANRIGIDTGAYLSDRLTVLILEGDQRRIIST